MSATITPTEAPETPVHPLTEAETRWTSLRSGARWRVRDIVWIAACIGLAAGWIESLYWCAKSFVLGGFTYVHEDIFWMSPLAHLVAFVIIGIPLGCVAQRAAHPVGGMFSIVILTMAGAMCALLLFPQLHFAAQLVLTVGAATQLGRWCEQHPLHARKVARRSSIALVGLTAVTAVGQVGFRLAIEHHDLAALSPADSRKPDVLLLVLDTVRADALGAYGATDDPTPNLDEFARRGVVFQQASSTASWTLPATASMMTGRLPGELSADWLTPMSESPRTLAETLRDNGYATAGFVANYKYATAETGLARGFARYDTHSYTLEEFVGCTALGRALFFSRLLPGLGCYSDPVRRSATDINNRYLAWADAHPGRPHFAFLNYLDAHDPYAAPAPFNVHRPAGTDERSLMRFWWFISRDSLTSSEKDLARNAYTDCLRYLDDEIGRLIDALNARGRLDETIIIITADHGEHFGEHDLWLHGNSLYDPLVHVPLMVIAPGHAPSDESIAAPVSTADLPATVLDLLDIADADIPGRSLAGVWSGAETEPRAVISEVVTPPITPPCQGASPIFRGSMQSVRLGDLKYIRNEDGGEELFNIAADPDELTNLAAQPERHDDLQRMRAALDQAL